MLATRTATLHATKRALALAPRSQLVSARAPAASAATRLGRLTTSTPVLPVHGARSFHAACRTCQEQLVKVPSMAESITEGTLKQWLKQKGDFVEADEEVATIETDKVTLALAVLALHSPLPAVEPSADTPCPSLDRAQIDVAVNAPSAGVLTDLLAQEEDTVTVGQDLFKLDTSASKPEGGGQSPSHLPLYTCCLSPSFCESAKFGGVGTGLTTTPHHPAAARPKTSWPSLNLARLTLSVVYTAAPKEESQPKEEKKEESKPKEEKEEPKPKQEEAKPEPKSEYRKPDSSQPAPKPVEQSKRDSSSSAEQPTPGKFSRNETKVRSHSLRSCWGFHLLLGAAPRLLKLTRPRITAPHVICRSRSLGCALASPSDSRRRRTRPRR